MALRGLSQWPHLQSTLAVQLVSAPDMLWNLPSTSVYCMVNSVSRVLKQPSVGPLSPPPPLSHASFSKGEEMGATGGNTPAGSVQHPAAISTMGRRVRKVLRFFAVCGFGVCCAMDLCRVCGSGCGLSPPPNFAAFTFDHTRQPPPPVVMPTTRNVWTTPSLRGRSIPDWGAGCLISPLRVLRAPTQPPRDGGGVG